MFFWISETDVRINWKAWQRCRKIHFILDLLAQASTSLNESHTCVNAGWTMRFNQAINNANTAQDNVSAFHQHSAVLMMLCETDCRSEAEVEPISMQENRLFLSQPKVKSMWRGEIIGAEAGETVGGKEKPQSVFLIPFLEAMKKTAGRLWVDRYMSAGRSACLADRIRKWIARGPYLSKPVPSAYLGPRSSG